ncbi:Uncharacterised protein [BD1-7 clade bacterium]|uniref:DUF4870 domain-containing protein n=1 Tax=BD1-7 clade bacterium TaxID=2029982 RepID=A0A5S9QF50_9GAMM|nr:Uncharacterised protein [BD1-7 clade bacterium]
MTVYSKTQTRLGSQFWATACHYSALAGLIFPFGNIIGPFLVWQYRKNRSQRVDTHGRAALNFQMNISLLLIGLLLLSGFFKPLVVTVYVTGLLSVIYAVVAAMEARQGNLFEYPFAFEMMRLDNDDSDPAA